MDIMSGQQEITIKANGFQTREMEEGWRNITMVQFI